MVFGRFFFFVYMVQSFKLFKLWDLVIGVKFRKTTVKVLESLAAETVDKVVDLSGQGKRKDCSKLVQRLDDNKNVNSHDNGYSR